MERPWPDEAIDFEAAVTGALRRLGDVDLARRCEATPELRAAELRPALEALGLFELDVRAGAAEAAAAARAMVAAGAVACPWPLVQQLSVPIALREEIDAVYLTDGEVRRLEHLDLSRRPVSLDFSNGGETRELVALESPTPAPLDPFGVPCELGAVTARELPELVGVYVVLNGFWVAGALRSARDLTIAHAVERRQFGRRIADFGGVQWHLSDMAIAHDSLWELACFNLGRMIDDRLAPADTLALQLTIVESALAVMRHGHQVLAAMGLCEEHDLTVLDRHLQPAIRRPAGPSRILGLLAEEISRSGFDNLYPVTATAPA